MKCQKPVNAAQNKSLKLDGDGSDSRLYASGCGSPESKQLAPDLSPEEGHKNIGQPVHPLLAVETRPKSAPELDILQTGREEAPLHPLLAFDPLAKRPSSELLVAPEKEQTAWRTLAPPEFAAELDFSASPGCR